MSLVSGAKDGHERDYDVFVIEDCCRALHQEQHRAVIDQMQRMTSTHSGAGDIYRRLGPTVTKAVLPEIGEDPPVT